MGRKKTDVETLEKRGSWRAKVKRKAEKSAAAPVRPARKLPPKVKPESMLEVIKLVPEYDPYAGADAYRFDEYIAADAVNFFQRKLAHVKGELAGKAFKLELWEQAIVANLFGWLSKETGYRRYREAFVEIGRKNGKTPLAAGIILYALFEDGEPGAEVYGAASEYKQASLVFTHAWGMVRQEDSLADRVKIFKGQVKAIELGQPGDPDYGIYRVICSDALTAHGFNTHIAVIDELHTQPDSELVEALMTSTGARRQPLIIYITTSDFERESSICNEKEDYAIKVRSGVVEDPTFLPVVYQADKDDDWTLEETWLKANPNFGISVSREYIERACKLAQESPRHENAFKRLHLNIRTEQDVRWLSMDKWDACDTPLILDDLVGCECFAGLDLSSTIDISALVLAFRKERYGQVFVLPFFWVPGESARIREKRDRAPYSVWQREGLVTFTDGDVVDYGVIRAKVNELGKIYNIREIAIDRWNATQLSTELTGDGFEVVPFGQGFASMSSPSKEFEALVLSRNLVHGGNAALRWMASNVAAEIDAAGNIKPSKKKSTERIDGIVALIMAIGVMIAKPEKKVSKYETQDVLSF